MAAVAVLLASGAGRDSHPPQGSETTAAAAARPGVEQVEPLGGKLYPPRYDTLDYELNQLVARHEGRDAAPGTPTTVAGRVFNVVVRVDPAHVHEVAAYLREQGAGVEEPRPGAESLAVAVPLSALADLAGRPGVHLVMAEPPIQRFDGGIAPHGADFWHDPGWYGGNANDADPNNDGGNIKIGIIDTGFASYSESLRTRPDGPLRVPARVPNPTEVYCLAEKADVPGTYDVVTDMQLCETATASSLDSHGTWVTELVYDIAPGADYYLARIDLASQFKDAITWLIAKDVDVISTSLGRTWEGPGDGTDPYANPYTDSWLSQVNRAVDNGIFVAVAAGNAGASSWYGTFRDRDNDNVMEWNDTRDECNAVQFDSSTNYSIRLRWEDTWNGADNDLDIYLRQGNSRGATAYMSEERQRGALQQDPIENIDLKPTSAVTYCLVIERAPGATTDWVQLVIEAEGQVAQLEHVTEGYSITSPGETTKAGVLTVGAASVLTPSTIQSTSGRGPLPASSASTVVKPDIVGVDNIRLSTSGNARVTGTSLATPHVAGLAALAKERYPGFSPKLIAAYLKDNALRRGRPAPDNPWGHGLAFLPHVGPVITGDPRVGGTLTADTDAVDDIDNLPDSPTFTYQWIRVSSGGNEADIFGATNYRYTPVQADVGGTIKVRVSFSDRRSNAEEQTSRASLRVVPAVNRAATGKPTIAGPVPLRVTHTLTASTSSIRDPDGVTGVTFEYQWVVVDRGSEILIPGATEASYVLGSHEEGKTVKVRVSFTDNNRNAETVVSDESADVGSAPNHAPAFSDTTASREVEENTPADQYIGLAITASDFENDTLTYSIRGGSSLFDIDDGNGQILTMGGLDYETRTRHTIVVQVTDNKDIDGMADPTIDDTITVTINVTDVDEPPTISGPQTVEWNENRAGTIATYTARDPEGLAVFLTLTDLGEARFFELSNGRLSFKSDALPNFEGRDVYSIELGAAAADPSAQVFDTTYVVTVNILDVDEPANISFLAAQGVASDGNALSVDENHDGVLATFSARDPENVRRYGQELWIADRRDQAAYLP